MIFIFSILGCAKVKEYLELHRHSPVILVLGHNWSQILPK
jgi:hypothetical protein